MLNRPRALVVGFILALTVPVGVPVAAQDGATWVSRVFSVTHAAVTTDLVTPGSDGHRLGDVRVNVATPTYDEQGELVGRYDAMLITTSIDLPSQGDEVRMVQLNFVFGEAQADQLAGSADQLIVSGSGYYPAGGSTLKCRLPSPTWPKQKSGTPGKAASSRAPAFATGEYPRCQPIGRTGKGELVYSMDCDLSAAK